MSEAARARASDPATSHAAAAKVRVTPREQQISDKLAASNGMTSAEIAAALNIGRDSVSPRMKALVAKEVVVAIGERNGQHVWHLRSVVGPW